MTKLLMKCGHVANGVKLVDRKRIPCCIICGCTEPSKSQMNLTNREAICADCHNKTKSKADLPFFKYRPDQKYDSYYDGCYGWD